MHKTTDQRNISSTVLGGQTNMRENDTVFIAQLLQRRLHVSATKYCELNISGSRKARRTSEGLVWLNGVVVCLVLHRRSNSSLELAMDGHIMSCGIISSCQLVATSKMIKQCCHESTHVSNAMVTIYAFLWNAVLTQQQIVIKLSFTWVGGDNMNASSVTTCWSSPAWRLRWECAGRVSAAKPNGLAGDFCQIPTPAVRNLRMTQIRGTDDTKTLGFNTPFIRNNTPLLWRLNTTTSIILLPQYCTTW